MFEQRFKIDLNDDLDDYEDYDIYDDDIDTQTDYIPDFY